MMIMMIMMTKTINEMMNKFMECSLHKDISIFCLE